MFLQVSLQTPSFFLKAEHQSQEQVLTEENYLNV